ncbi:MAG: hypothetical protein IJO56_06080 [Oscillospiraceae bacterium]|nr:hypothetical protein [Oscillospiraceae bacterium]
MRRVEFGVQPQIYALLAAMLLLLPLKWLTAAVMSVLLHEGCHLAVLKLFHTQVSSVRVGWSGVQMETAPIKDYQELLCALAGPGSCIIAFALADWFPRFAICAAFHAAYNMIPVYPLDGGRVMVCLLRMFLPYDTAWRICRVVEHFCVACFLFCGLYGAFILRLGFLPILISFFLTWKTLYGKKSCKERRLGVQ